MEGMDDSGEIFEAKISVRSKLQCGEVSELVTDKIRFLDRLFREKNKKQVKLKELWQIIYNEKLWCALDDEDAVRVSLLFVLEIVFMEYMWRYFYKRTVNVVKNHAEKKDPKKMTTYNLNGFVWALKDSIPNLVLVPTSKELKADLWVRSQYYFSGVNAPFIQSVKLKAIDFQRCESEVVDNVHAEEKVFPRLENVPVDVVQKQDGRFDPKIMDIVELLCKQLIDVRPEMKGMVVEGRLVDVSLRMGHWVQQGKAPPCSTIVQADAVKKQDVPLVQETQDVLGYVGSSFKGRFDPKIMDIVELLCKQLIDVRPEMKGMVDQFKTKVIDSLTTTVELVVEKDVGVVQGEVVNYEMNLVDCPIVKKDVGVVQGEVVNYEINLVDCPVVKKDVSDLKKLSCKDIEPSSLDHLINACAYVSQPSCRDIEPSSLDHLINAFAYVSQPLPFYDILKADNFGEPSEVNYDLDDYMDIENDPSKYCLDNMTIGIEEDTRSGKLTVTLY
ncbi:hypothetical protein Tco_1334321 [Tanacetum coccineum]